MVLKWTIICDITKKNIEPKNTRQQQVNNSNQSDWNIWNVQLEYSLTKLYIRI